jgi:hypothetical protein
MAAAPVAPVASAPAEPSISNNIKEVFTYRDYKSKMNDFTSKLDEIIYFCEMVDIDKIDQFLIDFIETYDFYKENDEDGDDNTDGDYGYSDLNNDKTIDELINKTRYTDMKTYIDDNSDKIKDLCKKLQYNDKIKNYLTDDEGNIETIKKDLGSQTPNIIEQIEKIIRLLEIRTNVNKIAPLPFEKLKFNNVALINKNDIICAISYSFFKRIYKKLHVLNNEDKGLNNDFLEVFKYEFYLIYTKLHTNFKEILTANNNTSISISSVIKNITEIKQEFETYKSPPQSPTPPQEAP